MRTFQVLDKVEVDDANGIIFIMCQRETESRPMISMRREGSYVAISASHGPVEIALRPRFQELARVMARLQPVDGLQTTRQVGTGQAYLAMGLSMDGSLLLRPTIVADATGHMTFNLTLTDEIRQVLYKWLPVEGLTT